VDRGEGRLAAFTLNGLSEHSATLGMTLQSIDQSELAEHLLLACHLNSAVSGRTVSDTMPVSIQLGRLYLQRSSNSVRYTDPAERHGFADKAKEIMKPILKQSEGGIRIAAVSWDSAMFGFQLCNLSEKFAALVSKGLLGKEDATAMMKEFRRSASNLQASSRVSFRFLNLEQSLSISATAF
jgi:hypothetical protein